MNLNFSKYSSLFDDIDIQFARFIGRLSPETDPVVMVAAALLSAATGSGDVCIDLARPLLRVDEGATAYPSLRAALPDPQQLRERVSAHPAVGSPGQVAPLVLDERGRLYLYRYWRYEQQLAAAFSKRAAAVIEKVPEAPLKAAIRRLFPETAAEGLAEQSLAAATAVLKPLCVVSGGPGTGKTTAAARIAALLLSLFEENRFRIRLAAPTGKAAARLRDSMAAAVQTLDAPEPVRNAVPVEAQTLHRMLEATAGRADFRRNRENPLAADAVIVDEASMVDVALMAKLIEAVPEGCRLILMGDRDQLASVEAGAVLGDLCGRKRAPGLSRPWAETLRLTTGIAPSVPVSKTRRMPGPGDAVVLLTRNFRFSENSGIGRFSSRVRAGDAAAAVSITRSAARSEPVLWQETGGKDAEAVLAQSILEGYRRLLRSETPEKALESTAGFKILCAVNRGPFGVETLNALALDVLQREGWVSTGETAWYPGRPVMITRNDYSLGLFNGDLGVVYPLPDSAELMVFFPADAGRVRAVSPFRIAAHQTAYAMTVHKSQGSEFDEVLLVLPAADNPVLTRELVYTAVTRARRKAVIFGSEAILFSAISRKVDRTSGLLDALWSGAGH